MKKGEQYEGLVCELKFPNKGLVRMEGEDGKSEGGARVTVKNTLPGQRVCFRLTKKRQGGMEGKLLEVLERSPKEDGEPFCVHFGGCGGCQYQTMSYESQLALKREQVKALLCKSRAGDGFEFEGILESPSPYAYRNKMEFSFGDEYKDGPLTLGLHKQGSFYDVFSVKNCQIVHEDLNRVVVRAREYLEGLGLGFYHKMSHKGYLRHLMLRRAARTGEVLVCLVTSSQWEKEGGEREALEGFRDALLALKLEGEIVGILQLQNDSLSDVVKSDKTVLLYGRDYFYESILGLRFRITPFSFFQTNSLGAEVLYGKVKEYMGEVEKPLILDLYSGTGTIAQMLSPIARKVVGVEIVGEAVAAARENAALNGIGNCEFVEGDVLKVLKEWEGRPDFIVLDPPREGVHPKALKRIVEFGVERMVYVSCKPTSLVRDLEALEEGGYRLVKAACVDLFAWGRNVETVCLLAREVG